jgi:AmiR/NasT family two-component response regulator
MASLSADRPISASPETAETASAAPSPDAQQLIDAAFDEFDVADLLESHSELVINLTETIERLERALETRGVIGQAIGICIERYDITAEQAFQFLTRVSQDHNVKLRDVAARLVERTVAHEG